MLGQKMMRCGSRIFRDKVSRKGRGKDRRGIINEAAGPQQGLWEIMTRETVGCTRICGCKSGTIGLGFEA